MCSNVYWGFCNKTDAKLKLFIVFKSTLKAKFSKFITPSETFKFIFRLDVYSDYIMWLTCLILNEQISKVYNK